MIESLRIEGFRSLDGVSIDPLGQFNLIVGPGNSGKTNLLEAIFLSCSTADPSLLPRALGMRNIFVEQQEAGTVVEFLDWYWAGRTKEPWFEISATWNGVERRVRFTRVQQKEAITFHKTSEASGSNGPDQPRAPAIYKFQVETAVGGKTKIGKGEVTLDGIQLDKPPPGNIPARYLGLHTQGSSVALAPIWDKVMASQEEERVLRLLQVLDPSIKSIRLGSSDTGKAQVRVDHKSLGRMPVEMLGCGFGKALAIASHLIARDSGVLLIDEFDSSLHVGAQAKVIQFAMEAAKRHTVQLFLSTHSLETLDAFLDAYHNMPDLWHTPADLRVLQLKLEGDLTTVRNLDAEKARSLRNELSVDLRRSG